MTIWHDRDEIPKKWSGCAVICITANHKSLHYAIYTGDEFMSHRKINNVQKWAYTEDLIKSAFKEPLLYMIRDKKTNELYESPVYSDAHTVFTSYRDADLESDILNQEGEDTEVVALYD